MYVCVCVRRMDKNSYNNSTSGGAVTQEEIIDSLNTSDGHKSGNTWHVQTVSEQISCIHGIIFYSISTENVALKCCRHLL